MGGKGWNGYVQEMEEIGDITRCDGGEIVDTSGGGEMWGNG